MLELTFGNKKINTDLPAFVMGIVNATPDSFPSPKSLKTACKVSKKHAKTAVFNKHKRAIYSKNIAYFTPV